MNKNIEEVLAQRGKRYGDFTDHARIAQRLQDTMRDAGVKVKGEGWDRLSVVQKQALSVIADKIARILSGDPNYDDNWIDIQGYAKLAQDRLPTEGEAIDNERRIQGHSTGRGATATEARGFYGPTIERVSAEDYAARVGAWRNPVGYPVAQCESPCSPPGSLGN